MSLERPGYAGHCGYLGTFSLAWRAGTARTPAVALRAMCLARLKPEDTRVGVPTVGLLLSKAPLERIAGGFGDIPVLLLHLTPHLCRIEDVRSGGAFRNGRWRRRA